MNVPLPPTATTAPRVIPAWALWENPIFIRYVRARLRLHHLLIWGTITLVISSAVFFLFRTIALYRAGMAISDAERAPIIPLLFLQAFILFILGTGQSAGGMTAEADEGVLDYQRLSPMTPLAKVVGYLFGLPVREWLIFGLTLPFTAWAVIRGGVETGAWLRLYGVLVSATLLYHLTGIVAGTVIKNRRWAFLVSIILVFCLYTIIPQVAKFGLVVFKYFTLWPVVEEVIPKLAPSTWQRAIRELQALTPDVRFFNLRFSEAVYTLFAQGALIVTFVVMLWRRWRRSDSHLMGKGWAVGLFAWLHTMLLGSSLPLVDAGLVFPSREFGRRFAAVRTPPSEVEAIMMIGLYGLVTLLLGLVLVTIVTPTLDSQIRGLRRAKKLGWASPPRLSDEAGALPFAAIMALIGAVAWWSFSNALLSSHWFGQQLPAHALPTFALVLLTATLAYHAMLEGWGGRVPFFAAIFGGVLPPMVGAIVASAANSWFTASTWLAGVSPVISPLYAILALHRTPISAEVDRAVPRSFWFWQAITLLVTLWLVKELLRLRKVRRMQVQSAE